MSQPTRGGSTVKILTGRTAAGLQRYRDSIEEGKEPCLLTSTRYCSHDVERQIVEWKAVRELHGTQGARRTQRATYESVDPDTGLHASGRRGTHVNEYRGGRWRKRSVRNGEMATHLRVEAGDLVVKESEAVHFIFAAGADLVNPDNPEDLQRYFAAVCAYRDEHYPGLQESRWLERNGESGLAHVHVASNATIFRDFTLNGIDYVAGRKMAGDLTRVHSVRAEFDRYLDADPQFGFSQALARVGTQEYTDAQVRDNQASYWEKRRGQETNQDRVRRAVGESLTATGVTDLTAFVAEMQARGVEVAEVGLRRGVPGKNHDLAYRVSGAKQSVRGRTLGSDFALEAVGAQLDRRARGLAIEPPAGRQHVGPRRLLPFEQMDGQPLSPEDQRGLSQLRADVEEMADRCRARRTVHPPPQVQAAALTAAAPAPVMPVMPAATAPDSPTPVPSDADQARVRRWGSHAPDATGASGVAEEAVASAGVAANSVEDAGGSYSSRLRNLTGTTEKARQELAELIALDEDYAARFAAGEVPDAEFENRATKVGIGRRRLDGKLGARLNPRVRDQLERREVAKAVRTAEFERAKQFDGEDFQAQMTQTARVRAHIKAGRYDQAAALSSIASRPQPIPQWGSTTAAKRERERASGSEPGY